MGLHRRRRGLARIMLLGAVGVFGVAEKAVAQGAESAFLQRAAASRAKGESGAPVLVYEFADFQCPHCARFARDVFPAIDSAYVRTGKVQWVFVNLPLPSHLRAWGAAEAALCAGGVADRFWPMHERLFRLQGEWSEASDPVRLYLDYAREIELPATEFEACLYADRVAPILLEDVISAVGSQVTGTPTFVIDEEKRVVGVRSFEEWRAILDPILERR